MAEGLLDKANIILTPTGYKAGTMYNVAPIEQPYEDFVFSRASVASRVNSSGLVEMVGRTLGSNLVQNGDFSDIGPDLVQNGTFDLGNELVTNGDFATDSDWTKGGGATITDGQANINGDGSTYVFINQSNIFTNQGATYKVTADVVITSGLGLKFQDGVTNENIGAATTTGSYTFYFTAGSNSTLVIARRTGGTAFESSVTNVSVKEVDPNNYWSTTSTVTVKDGFANITSDGSYQYLRQLNIVEVGKSYKLTYEITRQGSGILKSSSLGLNSIPSTVGTHTVYGLSSQTYLVIDRASACDIDITNIVVQELDPNDYWTLGTGWSIGDNALVGNSSTTENSQQIFDTTTTRSLKITFDAVVASGEVAVYMFGSTKQWVSTTGSYTIYVSSLAQDLEIDGRDSNAFTGSITNVSVQEVIDTNNIPRINYDSNGENGHWLLEPTSTNLFPYSEDFSGWTYVSPTSSVTVNNAVSPDGTSNADTISYVGGGGNDYAYYNGGFTTTSASTFSVYARTTVGTKNIALRTWNTGIYETKTITTEWQRFTLSISSNISSEKIGLDNRTTYGGSGTAGDIQVWGAQLEALSHSTSYIPTLTGSTETRATETANGAGSADLINSTEGVLYAEIAALANDGTFRAVSISDGSTSNVVRYYFSTTDNRIVGNVKSSGSNVFSFNHSLTTVTDYIKIALKYKVNDFALWVNGTEVSTDTSGAIPIGLTELAFDNGAGNDSFYGKCKALTVYNTALTDAELTELTS